MIKAGRKKYSGLLSGILKTRAKPFARGLVLFLTFLMFNCGLGPSVFYKNAYAGDDDPPDPPKQQSYSAPKVSTPSTQTVNTNINTASPQQAAQASSSSSWLTRAGQSLGIQKADGNVPNNAWFNLQVTNKGWQNISAASDLLGFKGVSSLTGAVAVTGGATTVKSDGNWNVQMTGDGSSIVGLKQQGVGNVAGAFWNSKITNSTQTGALNGLFASNGSTISGVNQTGLGNTATAANFSKINGLTQSGAFNISRAYNGSSISGSSQYGVGNFMSANNFSRYNNINQAGAFNMISNSATSMNNIRQFGFGNSITGNTGSSFSNINQFGAFHQMNNNALSSFNNINQIGAFNSMNNNVFSKFSNINQTGIGNSISNNKLSSFSNINQFGAFNQMNKNSFSTFNNINQIGAMNKINNNAFSTFSNINQTGIGNSISNNKLSSFSNINQFGAFNKMDNNIASTFKGINQIGISNSINKNSFSTFNGINQIGVANKINNNAFSSFNNISQTGIGNSISNNKLSSFSNINQFGAFNQINKNIASTFNDVNQFGAFNKMNNNIASTFSNINQYGLRNSISNNRFTDFSRVNQYGAFNSIDNNFGSQQFRSSFSYVNQFGAFNEMNNNINSSFKGVNQFGLGNSISNNTNSSFKYVSQHGAFNQINNNIQSTFKDINQTGLGNSLSNNSFSSFNDINQFGAFNQINNNIGSTFKGVIQSGLGNSLSNNKFSNISNITQFGSFQKIDNKSFASIKGMSDADFLDAKIKFNNSFAEAGLSALAPGLTYEQALEYREKYGDGTNVIPYQQRPRFSSNDGISDVTFSEGELRNFGPTWEGEQTNDLLHPNYNKKAATEWIAAIIAQPGNEKHSVANRRYEEYREEALAKGEKPMSVEDWNKSQIQKYSKELTQMGVLSITVKGKGDVMVSREYMQSLLNQSPAGMEFKYYGKNLPDVKEGAAPLTTMIVENNESWKALYAQGGGNPKDAPAGFVRDGVLYVHAPSTTAIPHENIHGQHTNTGMTNNYGNGKDETGTQLAVFSGKLDEAVAASGDKELIAAYAALKEYYRYEYASMAGQLYSAVERGELTKEKAVEMAQKYNVNVVLNDGSGRTIFDLSRSDAEQAFRTTGNWVAPNSWVATEIMAASHDQLRKSILAGGADEGIRDYSPQELAELRQRYTDIPVVSHENVVREFLAATEGHPDVQKLFQDHYEQVGVDVGSGDFARFYKDYQTVVGLPNNADMKAQLAAKGVTVPNPADYSDRKSFVAAATEGKVPYTLANDMWMYAQRQSSRESVSTKSIEVASVSNASAVSPVMTSGAASAVSSMEAPGASGPSLSDMDLDIEAAAMQQSLTPGAETYSNQATKMQDMPRMSSGDLEAGGMNLGEADLQAMSALSANTAPSMQANANIESPKISDTGSPNIDVDIEAAAMQQSLTPSAETYPSQLTKMQELPRMETESASIAPSRSATSGEMNLGEADLSALPMPTSSLPEPDLSMLPKTEPTTQISPAPAASIEAEIGLSKMSLSPEKSSAAASPLVQLQELPRMETQEPAVMPARAEPDLSTLTDLNSSDTSALSIPRSNMPEPAMSLPSTIESPSMTLEPAPAATIDIEAKVMQPQATDIERQPAQLPTPSISSDIAIDTPTYMPEPMMPKRAEFAQEPSMDINAAGAIPRADLPTAGTDLTQTSSGLAPANLPVEKVSETLPSQLMQTPDLPRMEVTPSFSEPTRKVNADTESLAALTAPDTSALSIPRSNMPEPAMSLPSTIESPSMTLEPAPAATIDIEAKVMQPQATDIERQPAQLPTPSISSDIAIDTPTYMPEPMMPKRAEFSQNMQSETFTPPSKTMSVPEVDARVEGFEATSAAKSVAPVQSLKDEGYQAASRTFEQDIRPLNENINGKTSSTYVDVETGRVFHIASTELAPVALKNSIAAEYTSDDGRQGIITVGFKEPQEMARVQSDMQAYTKAGFNNYSALLAALGRNDYGDHGESWNPGEQVGNWQTTYNGRQSNQILRLDNSANSVLYTNTNNTYITGSNGLRTSNYSDYNNERAGAQRRGGFLRNIFLRNR